MVNGQDLFMMLKLRILFIVSIFLHFLTGCSNVMAKKTTFDWGAAESGPKGYPMEVISGTFLFKGEKRGLYVPNGATLHGGWGKPRSSHGHIDYGLPDRLKITFFSYVEKQFYQGEFELPYDTMVKYFQAGVEAFKSDEDMVPTYSKIVAGVAPGGVVAVWVTGRQRVEVFFGKAKKIELDPSKAFDLPFDSEEESNAYIEKQLPNSLTPDELDSLNKKGIPFGLWSRYRNRYLWAPVDAEGYSLKDPNTTFVNGEFFRRFKFYELKDEQRLLPAPVSLLFRAKGKVYEVYFEEYETMEAFEKLYSNEKLIGDEKFIRMEFDFKVPQSDSRVRLYNSEESIELKKVVFKD